MQSYHNDDAFFSGIVMGWLRFPHQHHPPPRAHPHDHWPLLSPSVCCLLHPLCHWHHSVHADLLCGIPASLHLRAHGGKCVNFCSTYEGFFFLFIFHFYFIYLFRFVFIVFLSSWSAIVLLLFCHLHSRAGACMSQLSRKGNKLVVPSKNLHSCKCKAIFICQFSVGGCGHEGYEKKQKEIGLA